MKDYEVMVGLFEKHEILFMLFWGWVAYLFHVFVYILCIAHPFCVCWRWSNDLLSRRRRFDRWARRCI